MLVASRFVGKGNVFIDSSEHSLGTEFIVVEVVTDAYVVCRKIGTEQYSFLHTENLSDVKDTPKFEVGDIVSSVRDITAAPVSVTSAYARTGGVS